MRTVTRIIVEGSLMQGNVNAVYSNDTNVTVRLSPLQRLSEWLRKAVNGPPVHR